MTQTATPPPDTALIVNIAAYRFVTLDRLEQRRSLLCDLTHRLGLKGTILLSTEGINLFLAGSREAVDEFLEHLRREDAFADLPVKESFSQVPPFGCMKVKLKREIIPLGIDGIAPAETPAPALSAKSLRRWLDEGREVILLDVRNEYEIEHGTFENAVTLGLDHFRNLPAAVAQLPPDVRTQPIVMFCTGGIRCEKAGPFLLQQGFNEVYQLDGGILKYFEECGDAHYRGNCFVFDERVAVDPGLQPTDAPQIEAPAREVTPLSGSRNC